MITIQLIKRAKMLAVCLLSCGLLFPVALPAKTVNDNLFPPGPTAVNAIDFDGRGFIIGGQRTFLVSGSVHYARVPREDWRDILLKLKRAGFNTVETYVFWSYHEEHEGQFDFATDSRDLGAFLDTAKEVGLYAIIRVGPYSCAEWENGGFPNWLYFKAGLEVRKDNKPFMVAMDSWFDRMLPIISSRQINKGGNVILVQLENEYPAASWKYWGTEVYGNYFQHLLDLSHTNGLEVPMFFSGLNHGHDPAPIEPINAIERKSPWMSTELWTIWFDHYGLNKQDLLKGERSTWRVLSEGGSGFNLYMAYGGTTFGFFNFNNDTKFGDRAEKGMACYDYGTLIGQAGDTRDLYLRLKRLGYFAESFSSILAAGTNSTSQYLDFASDIKVTARTAPSGTLVFLDNGTLGTPTEANDHAKTSPGPATNASLKAGGTIKLAEGEIIGLAVNFSLAQGVAIAEADTRILGMVSQGGITTMVCYGEPEDTGKITFKSRLAVSEKMVRNAEFKFDVQNNPRLLFKFPNAGVGEEDLFFGKKQIRVLVMNKSTADQTWFVDTEAGRKIVIGAPYLGAYTADTSGKERAVVDYPWNEAAPNELNVYGNGDGEVMRLSSPPQNKSLESLTVAEWQMSVDNGPLTKNLDDSAWFALPHGYPPAMGADGDYSAFAWYHARLTNNAVISSLTFRRIGDRATFFIDGKHVATYDLNKDKAPEIALNVPAGTHDLAVFTAHFGRAKFSGYVGPIDKVQYQKGLCAPVTINGTNDDLIANWKLHGGVDPENKKMEWSTIRSTDGAPAYFRTTFKLVDPVEPGATYRFAADGLSFGSVWVNGHNVGRYPEIVNGCPGLWLPTCWLKTGENSLVVYDERGSSPASTSVTLETSASRHQIVFSK
jgi:beta-galactosidase